MISDRDRNRPATPSRPFPLNTFLTGLYALLLIYGTLFPLQGWETPVTSPFALMLQHGLQRTSRADLLTNILVYIPFGFLLMTTLSRRITCAGCRFFLTVLVGSLLSLTLEYMQAHIPSRVPSLGDFLLNTSGTGIGALIALITRQDALLGKGLLRLRSRYFRSGATANIGLAVLALWALSQLGPLVPSLDMDNLRQGIKPLVKSLQDPASMKWLEIFEYAASIAALGMIFLALQKVRYGSMARFAGLAAAVLLLKILIVGRQLSLEAVMGTVAGIVLVLLFSRMRPSTSRPAIAFLLIAYVIIEAVQPGNAPRVPTPFNWIPFRSHMSNNISGILDILGGLWPFLGLSYLAVDSNSRGTRSRLLAPAGTFAVFICVFALEWYQQYLPGRSADITDAILASLAWLFPWLYVSRRKTPGDNPQDTRADDIRHNTIRRPGLFILLTLVVAGASIYLAIHGIRGVNFEGDTHRTLPAPEDLPPVSLPTFHYAHPRLPAPTARELERLREHNPKLLRSRLKRARNGKGAIFDVIFSAYVEPGSQDLDRLFERLMALKITWRGHMQAKPLALAYDWLHDQWTPKQRRLLAERVVEASNYLIKLIRNDKLSPYNVYLYNSPFQALMATAIATYGDLETADLPMRWTTDYWKNRVLPVWHQIMGENGGWHEGGEYVGIGMGQAIYQLPAMWQKATGENLFANDPGIRGFADFLLYRVRPDNTDMRWGDGHFFDRPVPDKLSLAMAVGNKALYSHPCPKPGHPTTSWPWGGLTSDKHCDDTALERKPLDKLFDGIGMVIARSDWGKDATYVTFKAGDNYWSHTHLDQGAFTIFKGGPLAIDSGYYGVGYGTDHHLNYQYQTIAHNVITVTDPQDRVPMPPKKRNQEPRPIANDGGQRRVGSGWGIRAPLDRSEWEELRETYHTGRIAKYYSDDNLVVAVADLTPAYSNRLSGQGTFANRTFRVRKYWRTFIYDRREDLVIIHDDIVSADPAFRKRSLIHTLEKPRINRFGFQVEVPSRPSPQVPARDAGELKAFVLYPRDAEINVVGGKGKEFLVDGKNYDENGKLWDKLHRRKKNPPEPGRWRVEISPPFNREHDIFLMVLIPGKRDLPPLIEPVREKQTIGTRIMGLHRTLTVLFPTDRQGVSIKIKGIDGVNRTIDLTLPPAPLLQQDTGIWGRLKRLLGAAP